MNGKWLMTLSTFNNVVRGDDPVTIYVPKMHYCIDGHALCNEKFVLSEDSENYIGFRCRVCLKKLEKMNKVEK